MAQVTDWSKLNLLEGEANIYFEGTFIGKSVLDVNTAGDTLSFLSDATGRLPYSARKSMNIPRGN